MSNVWGRGIELSQSEIEQLRAAHGLPGFYSVEQVVNTITRRMLDAPSSVGVDMRSVVKVVRDSRYQVDEQRQAGGYQLQYVGGDCEHISPVRRLKRDLLTDDRKLYDTFNKKLQRIGMPCVGDEVIREMDRRFVIRFVANEDA